MNTLEQLPEIMTLKETAAYYRCSERHIQNLIVRGLPHSRQRGRFLPVGEWSVLSLIFSCAQTSVIFLAQGTSQALRHLQATSTGHGLSLSSEDRGSFGQNDAEINGEVFTPLMGISIGRSPKEIGW